MRRTIMRRTSIILIFFATICGIRVLAQAPATAGPERGTLVLDGGDAIFFGGVANSRAVMQKFAQLAGGPGARIVVIPTAWNDDELTPEMLKQLHVRAQEFMGVERVTVMHTRDRKQADSPEFVTSEAGHGDLDHGRQGRISHRRLRGHARGN